MDRNTGKDGCQIDSSIEGRKGGVVRAHGRRTSFRNRVRDELVRLRTWTLRFPHANPLPQEGRDAEIIRLIVRLQEMRSITSKELRTGADVSITRITSILRVISVSLFLIMLVSLCVFLLNVVDPAYPRYVAIFANFVLTVLVLLCLALDILIPFFCIIFAPEFEFRSRQLELAHDLRMAVELRGFDLGTLKAGEQWLGIKLERLKFHMLLMFGGSDKLALFALVGLAWTMKNLLQSNDGPLPQQWTIYILAGLLGTTIGGVLTNVVVKRLLYQKDIVALAIREREEEAASNLKP